MSGLHLLVLDAYAPEGRAALRGAGGTEAGRLYERMLRALAPDAAIDVAYPADPDPRLPSGVALADYDGICWTGSSLTIHDAQRRPRAAPDRLRTGRLRWRACRASAAAGRRSSRWWPRAAAARRTRRGASSAFRAGDHALGGRSRPSALSRQAGALRRLHQPRGPRRRTLRGRDVAGLQRVEPRAGARRRVRARPLLGAAVPPGVRRTRSRVAVSAASARS